MGCFLQKVAIVSLYNRESIQDCWRR